MNCKIFIYVSNATIVPLRVSNDYSALFWHKIKQSNAIHSL